MVIRQVFGPSDDLFVCARFLFSENPVAASYHLGPPGKRLDARPAAETLLFTVNYS